MKKLTSNLYFTGAVLMLAFSVWTAALAQRPINVGPAGQAQASQAFAGVPRPSASVKDQADTTVTLIIPAAFATALEKDRVDTLIPIATAQGFDMRPLNKDASAHLMYLLLQDGGPLVTVFRKYPPASVQTGIDAANAAAQSVQQQINAAREATRKK